MTRFSLKMPPSTAPNSLQSTPFGIFAICLAFLGLGLCWRLAPYPFGVGHLFGETVLGAGYVLTGGAFLCQFARFYRFSGAVMNELCDPIRGPIVLQPVIALQLIAESLLTSRPMLAETLIVATTTIAVIASFGMLFLWCRQPGYTQIRTPTWLIPGISLGVASFLCGLQSWVFASEVVLVLTVLWFAGHVIGLLFTTQNQAVPDPLRPLCLIYHAPLPILYLAWTQTQGTGGIAFMLLITATAVSVTLCLWGLFKLRAPFGYPWWAAGMPPMVLVLAMLAPHGAAPDLRLMHTLALLAFWGVHLAFVSLLLATLQATLRGQVLPLVSPSHS